MVGQPELERYARVFRQSRNREQPQHLGESEGALQGRLGPRPAQLCGVPPGIRRGSVLDRGSNPVSVSLRSFLRTQISHCVRRERPDQA